MYKIVVKDNEGILCDEDGYIILFDSIEDATSELQDIKGEYQIVKDIAEFDSVLGEWRQEEHSGLLMEALEGIDWNRSLLSVAFGGTEAIYEWDE